MPIKRIKRKIEDLRQQPEHVRVRAAMLLTAGGGVVFAILWLAVLLPLQLKFNGSREATEPVARQVTQPVATPTTQLGAQDNVLAPQVGGIRDTRPGTLPLSSPLGVPSPQVGFPFGATFSSPTPTPAASPTVSPTATGDETYIAPTSSTEEDEPTKPVEVR